MEIKKLDDKGIKFLIDREGLRLKPYLDSKGIPTIGIGCTYYPNGKKVTMQDSPITRQAALSLFATVLKHYELTVYSVTRDDIIQNQFNALVSLCYNIGVNAFKGSTVCRLVNQNPYNSKIKDAFLMWVNPKELKERRELEVELYFT